MECLYNIQVQCWNRPILTCHMYWCVGTVEVVGGEDQLTLQDMPLKLSIAIMPVLTLQHHVFAYNSSYV